MILDLGPLSGFFSETEKYSTKLRYGHDLEEGEWDVAEDGEDEGDVVGELGQVDGGVDDAENDQGGDLHHPQDELAAHVDCVLAIAALKK